RGVDGLRERRINVGGVFAARVFVFGRGVEERSALDDRTAEGHAAADSCQRRTRAAGLFELWSSVECTGLAEEKRVAVDHVGATLGHDVDAAAGGAAVFSGPSVVDDLKLADDFERQLRAAAAGVFVAVVEA